MTDKCVVCGSNVETGVKICSSCRKGLTVTYKMGYGSSRPQPCLNVLSGAWDKIKLIPVLRDETTDTAAVSTSYTVVEWCPHCEHEVEMQWDVEQDGFKAYCPYCGKRLMLCDECQHRENGEYSGDCNYDSETDTCRFNRGEASEEIAKDTAESGMMEVLA